MVFTLSRPCFGEVASLQKQIHAIVTTQNSLGFLGSIKYFDVQGLYFFGVCYIFLLDALVGLVCAGFGTEDDVGRAIICSVIGAHALVIKL